MKLHHHLLHPVARWYVASLALVTVVLLSACALAAQPVELPEPSTLSGALTSGLLWPAIGAAVVLIAWLFSKVKSGTPFVVQVKHLASSALPALVAGLASGGLALMAGQPVSVAIGAAVTVLLMGANVRAPSNATPGSTPASDEPTLPPPESMPDPDSTRKTSIVAIVLAGLLSLAAGGCAGWLPAVLEAVVTAGQYAQLVRAAVDAAERAAAGWFGLHPDAELQQQVADATARCRLALTALDKAALAAQKTQDADLAGAKAEVAEAYAALYGLLELGGEMGAGPGESRRPSDELLTPAEIEGLL